MSISNILSSVVAVSSSDGCSTLCSCCASSCASLCASSCVSSNVSSAPSSSCVSSPLSSSCVSSSSSSGSTEIPSLIVPPPPPLAFRATAAICCWPLLPLPSSSSPAMCSVCVLPPLLPSAVGKEPSNGSPVVPLLMASGANGAVNA